ncbi:hypothetical protein [Bacillus sp. AFS040349]|uniref:hypothetical protein n=1 Tax=Bacillus sp. AFS040349 TaxID=2033502 RepID=UPI000BFC0833|nr:hypothetical protein [Bacillus sp. AFS040349]PGT89234.1 hypothetical protein COD11_04340 [Bacillus sp. AFS040349]
MKKILVLLACVSIVGCSNDQETQSNLEETELIEEVSTDQVNEKPSTEVVEEEIPEESYTEDVSIEESTSTETESDILSAGEEGIILKDVYLSLGEDKTNLDVFMDYVTAKDVESVYQMEIDGKIKVLTANTPITLIENDILSVKVKVNNTGDVGWLPYEYVGKKN